MSHLNQYEIFHCVICNEKVGPYSRGITFHAKKHGYSLQEYWLVQNGFKKDNIPTCKCANTCKKQTLWNRWDIGFHRYVKGHSDIIEKSKYTSNALKQSHWSRGKTKHTDFRLKLSGQKTSQTLKKKFQSGEINHWKNSPQREDIIKKITKNRSVPIHNHHWKWSNEIELLSRVDESSGKNFVITTRNNSPLTKEFLESRINNQEKMLNVKCNRCNVIRNLSVYSVVRGILLCAACDKSYTSQFESEVFDYVSSLTNNVLKRKLGEWGEIDIFVPEYNFAIECNGLYWHSDAIQSDKNYHEKKRIACIKNGISLFHLFEDEWRNKRDLVKSMLSHRLYKSKSIGARKFSIKEISLNERKEFFNENHIDGNAAAKISFGLVDNDDNIFAAASFRTPIFQKDTNDIFEIARFAMTKNIVVPGALPKLVKAFTSSHPYCVKLISYQDTRFGGSGSHYIKSGFVLERIGSPRFWWTDTIHRFDRMSTKATDVPEVLNAIKQRRFKIWGTSNFLWQKAF